MRIIYIYIYIIRLLHVVNKQICYGLKNIAKSFLIFDLWVLINSIYQNMIGYKKNYVLNFLSIYF
jgi:hypothetical protein